MRAIRQISLTTHFVKSLKNAVQILTWHTWRWIIEQIFRIMKNKELKIEDSQIEDLKKLQILSVLCVVTAIKVMLLVESCDGNNKRSVTDLFSKDELKLFSLLCKKLEGKTEKQKKRMQKKVCHGQHGLLHVWNGYASESPLGPIIMLRELQKSDTQYEGWLLTQ